MKKYFSLLVVAVVLTIYVPVFDSVYVAEQEPGYSPIISLQESLPDDDCD